jgi:tetratricopeptide (TPR) repeat protein
MKEELERLRQMINHMPRSAAKVALLEEAIGLADSANDLKNGYKLRLELVDVAQFTGFPEKALVAFGWALAKSDRDPDKFDGFELLWKYKWIASDLRHFPQITLHQIDDALDDLARRSQSCGASLRHVHSLRSQLARHLGQHDKAREELALWKKTPRDYLSDCVACERDNLADVHAFLGEDEQAIETSQPILDGKMKCGEIPHLTYAHVLLPLMRLNRTEEAANYHRAGYRMIKDNPDFLWEVADHLIYRVLTRDLAGAAALFETHLHSALSTHALLRRYWFYRSALFLMRHLQKTGTSDLVLRLPEGFPIRNDTARYAVGQLKEWLEQEAGELARQFDARSGNGYREKELAEFDELDSLVRAA